MNFEYIFSESALDSEQETSVFELPTENWNRDDTFRLIALFKKHNNLYQSEESKTAFWQFIQKHLEKQNIVVSSEVISHNQPTATHSVDPGNANSIFKSGSGSACLINASLVTLLLANMHPKAQTIFFDKVEN